MGRRHFTFYEYSGYEDQNGTLSDSLTPFGDLDTIKQFEDLTRVLIPTGKLFNISQNTIKATHYVGCFTFRDMHIEILPKLFKYPEKSKSIILKNLITMLAYTLQLDVSDADLSRLDLTNMNFLQVYIAIYSRRLLAALKRTSPSQYVQTEENINFVRGKIKIGDHLRVNSTRPMSVFCSFDEFSQDNLITQTIKYVSRKLLELTRDVNVHRELLAGLKMMDTVTLREIRYADVSRVSLPRNLGYLSSLFSFCKMFLANMSSSQQQGGEHVVSILFDMNSLFEEFVFRIIERNQSEFNFISPPEMQKQQKLISGVRTLPKTTFKKAQLMNTYTDIQLHFPEATLILDTKNRLLLGNPNSERIRLKNHEIYQIIAYGALYERAEMRPQVGLLFPGGSRAIAKEFTTNPRDQKFFVATINLQQDLQTEIHSVVKELKKLFNGLGLGLEKVNRIAA
jgi:5-methylcytosine-specific restriction enzyme subunit McrC